MYYNNRGSKPNYNANAYKKSYSNNNQQQKKHSGCVSKTYAKKTGGVLGSKVEQVPMVRGWKYDKRNGIRTFIASPYSKTKKVTSKQSGRTYENWVVKVTEANGVSHLHGGMYEPSTGKVVISDLSFVMNPRASNGGYVGPYYKRKN